MAKRKKVMTRFDRNKSYSLSEALNILRQNLHEKFDASIELHANLGIDPKKNEHQIRATVTLPHSFGKPKKILAFITPELEKEAKDAGVDIVGAKELIDEIKQTEKINFDIAIAVPALMKDLASIAKILGPKGLMPSPKNETITSDIKKTVGEIRKGKITYKNDDTGNIHVTVGKASLNDGQITENFEAMLQNLKRNKPSSSKGQFIKNLTICSSMGPGIKIAVAV